jgi:hypothetical protein
MEGMPTRQKRWIDDSGDWRAAFLFFYVMCVLFRFSIALLRISSLKLDFEEEKL